MIVVDASAVVEALVAGRSDALLETLSGEVDAPHVLDVEVLSVLRGLVLGGKLDVDRADTARSDFLDLDIRRHAAAPHAERIWRLRHQFTTYDAAYISLAEALDCPLHTCDRRMSSPGHDATVAVWPLAR